MFSFSLSNSMIGYQIILYYVYGLKANTNILNLKTKLKLEEKRGLREKVGYRAWRQPEGPQNCNKEKLIESYYEPVLYS